MFVPHCFGAGRTFFVCEMVHHDLLTICTLFKRNNHLNTEQRKSSKNYKTA